MKTSADKTTALALWIGAGIMILPFVVMLSTSLMPAEQVFAARNVLWPEQISWQNYQKVLGELSLAGAFGNSMIVAVCTTLGHVLIAAMAGWGLARYEFKGRNFLFLLFLLTLMIPPQINLVPLFFLMKQFNLLDTLAALIIPGLFGAFGVFMLRQWFLGFPQALEESAVMDGCNPWQVFWHIGLPLARPALSALALFVFIGAWNGFMWPLVALHSEANYTLPLGIAMLKSGFRDNTHWELLMAAATLSLLPVVALFAMGQKQLLRGLMSGALKE